MRIWSFSYDPQGRLDVVRDTLHRMTRFGYNAADRLTAQTLPGAREIGFDYDRVGNLRSLTLPLGFTHQFAYTRTGLNKRYTPPGVDDVDSVASVYEFNDDRQLTQITRPGGSVVSLAYDGAKGRLDSLTVARGQAVLYYSPSTGQLDSLSSPDTVTVDYRYLGPLPTIERWSGHVPGGETLSVARVPDQFFRDSVETVSGTAPVTYRYDDDGLLEWAGPLSLYYRADNGALDSTHVAAGAGALASSADYDGSGDIRNLRYRHSAAGVLFQQSVSRDELGRVTRVDETAFGTRREWEYRYDEAGRLYVVMLAVNGGTSDTAGRYLYDANGNRTQYRGETEADTASATYDAQDRLLRHGNDRYEYTPAGELRRQIAGGNTTTYTYDALGNLLSVRFASGDSVSYAVDGVNRRVGRKWNGAWTGGWIYADALRPIAELDASGAVVSRYVYGAEGASPSLLLRGDTTYRVIVDYLGSVRGVVEVASGVVAQEQRFGPGA